MDLTRRRTGPTVRSATEPRQLPAIGSNIVTQDVNITLRVLRLEVPMIGSQPAVDDLGDLDLALPKPEASRCLLATIAGVALDIHSPECGRVSRHGSSDSLRGRTLRRWFLLRGSAANNVQWLTWW